MYYLPFPPLIEAQFMEGTLSLQGLRRSWRTVNVACRFRISNRGNDDFPITTTEPLYDGLSLRHLPWWWPYPICKLYPPAGIDVVWPGDRNCVSFVFGKSITFPLPFRARAILIFQNLQRIVAYWREWGQNIRSAVWVVFLSIIYLSGVKSVLWLTYELMRLQSVGYARPNTLVFCR